MIPNTYIMKQTVHLLIGTLLSNLCSSKSYLLNNHNCIIGRYLSDATLHDPAVAINEPF